MSESNVTPTRSAFLELMEERAGMQEGYGFLDEKRLILAAEILRELTLWEEEMTAFRGDYAKAAAALRAAAARHGLQGLELYPPAPCPTMELPLRKRGVLGVTLQELDQVGGEEGPFPASLEPSPEAEQSRRAFSNLLPRAARLAVRAGNLERLRLEYSRTARRARALEDVLLPEIDETLKGIDAALEELDREEAVRVRRRVFR